MAAFFLVGAPAALLCGWLADKYNRIKLLVIIIFIGETPCLCTYWVTQLWHFFLVRTLTGIAVGGCFPLVFSLLGDLFPVSQRNAMSALVQIAVGAGIGGGQLLAGVVGPATNWRVPFVVLAAPTLLLAIVLLFTAQEPPRGAFEEALSGQLAAGAEYSETITWHKLRLLLAIPSNWLIILQGLPGCLPWGVMQTYITDYLHINKGYTVELATVVLLLFGVGCAVGVIAGGAAGQLLYNWRKESMAVLTGASVLAGVGPMLALVNADLQAIGFGATLVLSALAGVLVSIAGPNLRAIMLNVNTPETRGVAIALQSVTDDLGRGLGPVIVAGFISSLGRQTAFNISAAGWVPCGILLLSLVFTMRKDESNMQTRLAAKAEIALETIRVTGLSTVPSCQGSVQQEQQLSLLAPLDAVGEGTTSDVVNQASKSQAPNISNGLMHNQKLDGQDLQGSHGGTGFSSFARQAEVELLEQPASAAGKDGKLSPLLTREDVNGGLGSANSRVQLLDAHNPSDYSDSAAVFNPTGLSRPNARHSRVIGLRNRTSSGGSNDGSSRGGNGGTAVAEGREAAHQDGNEASKHTHE
eukprot:GHRR01006579.1.p1 GENE.GHRR01006579.1~~GHRR01006579.1.p1  ORF type:complete len:583 (+),score=156.80 GHRR01006579.1:972-2720(+)